MARRKEVRALSTATVREEEEEEEEVMAAAADEELSATAVVEV
jgi:hypothetical protein